ncbi:MAG: helix-turn-helix transcriptional regulator [Actinomycetota bacterium]
METVVGFGPQLRQWRSARRMSQLDLATEAEVSQRHLSFLENGRSKPSPEMVVHLGRVLDLPLRDQNVLLTAAGYAPAFGERSFDDPDLEPVLTALQRMLDAHGPYPAYVIDRGWDLVLANPAALRLLALLDPAPPPEVAANIARLSFHPDGLRRIADDWDTTAAVLFDRLERELHHRPGDDRLRALRDEIAAYPGVPRQANRSGPITVDELVLPLTLRIDGGDRLRFFTTITTIGAAFDVTLEELRLETLLPADAVTEVLLRDAGPGRA